MKFYDRQKELELLTKANRVAVVGRRRIGKTRLLEEAMPDNYIYLFFYSDASEAFIVEKWTAAVKKELDYMPSLSRVTDILEYVFQQVDAPVIIDEIQNALKKFPEFISLLQQLMDRFKEKKVYVTGSLISVMKKVVEDYKGPVFGRFDFVIKLKELDLPTVMEIMADLGYPREEALKYYSIFGGIPKYYELIETLRPENFNEFIDMMFFKYPRPLFNEIYIMLKEEIGKEYSSFFGVLHAIALKGVTFGSIASALNMKSNSISKYLDASLKDYELIRQEQPVSQKKKKTHYYINSNIIEFWFTYCFNHMAELDRGNEDFVYERFLNHFPTYFGWKFERMVIDLLPLYLKKDDISYRTIGKDWGGDYEFDFVVENGGKLIVGEIKTGELNAAAEIKKIESVIRNEPFYKDKEIGFLFVAGKFTNKVENTGIIYVDKDSFFEL